MSTHSQKTLAAKAIQAIDQHGLLLVYPLKNKRFPASIWSVLYPRTEMVWSWDEDSDGRVGKVWMLKEELSKSREVVYGKWFKGRATFFSKECFVWMRAMLREIPLKNPDARRMKELLEMDSPLSTKQLRAELELQGRSFERQFVRAARDLWERLDIVGFGEIQDSSFPSMAFAAAPLIFEDECRESEQISAEFAEKALLAKLGPDSEFLKYAQKLRKNAGIRGELP